MQNGTINGGMVVSRALSRYGIRTVFAVAGASHTFLLDALDRDGFRIVSSRHESGCVSAADGYARITGRLGVALIIADQGTPNAINGIAAAFHACSPVLVLIARLPNSWTEAESEYDNAKHPLVGPITKWARTVPAAERLAEFIDAGAKRALGGRCGPVVLQIPQEYFSQTLADYGAAAQPAPLTARPAADPSAIDAAADLLAGAERPLLIAGAGAAYGNAGPALQTLVERFDMPIAGNGLGRGVVPEDWERSFSWPLMQIAAKDADVVCVVGARLKQRLGYGLTPRFSPAAKFIQIDVMAEELSRNRRVDVPISADAGLAASQLVTALERRRAPRGLRALWLGAGSDRTRNAELAARHGIDATDRFSIPQLAELARQARFAVTNDSGPMHACAAAGVPVFGLFGPSDWRRNHALGQREHVLACTEMVAGYAGQRTGDCLAALEVDLVWQRLTDSGVFND